MRSKIIASILIACIIISLNIEHIVDASNPSLEDINKAKNLREVYGLSVDNEVLNNLFQSKNTRFVLGVPFSPEEIKELEKREKVFEELPNIERITRSFNNDQHYGGIYYKPETGEVVVKLVNPSGEIKNSVKVRSNFPESIKFEDADFQYHKLLEAEQLITDNRRTILSDIPIYSWGIDVINNRLKISTNRELTIAEKMQIGNIVNSKMIEYTISEFTAKPALYEQELRKKQTSVFGGVQIQNTTNECSAGFHARDSSGNNILVTAGHCDSVGVTDNL